LAEEGLVSFEPNPHHRRAQLVVLTDKGKQVFDAAMSLQAPWVNRLSDGLAVEEIEAAHRVVMRLQANLDDMNDTGSPD
jgi:DNA-binding MarR family transcriptional regulator